MRKESIDFADMSPEPVDHDSIDDLGRDAHVEIDASTEQEIREVLQSNYWLLRFPPHLETLFENQYLPRAIKLFHYRAPFLFFLFLAENVAIYQILPEAVSEQFFSINAWTGVVILIAATMSFIPKFSRWYEWYIGVGGMVAIAVSTVTANMGGAEAGILTYAGIIYIVILLYSFVCLRFQTAVAFGWMGGLFGIILANVLGQEINWKLYNLTYTITSLLGMCLAYGLDRQERTSFLQECLLQHSVDKGQQLARRLDALSRQDGLTGLANRRHLDEMMNQEWNRALRQHQSLVLMIIDVDFFKNYNDKLGHLAGDECLRQIGALLLSLAKRSGELAARYGGEEFVLMFPSMDGDIAEEQARRLLDRMAALQLKSPDEDRPFVTVSLGIAVGLPSSGMCVEQLLRQADAALYKAKANGRNRYEFFDDAMRTAGAHADSA